MSESHPAMAKITLLWRPFSISLHKINSCRSYFLSFIEIRLVVSEVYLQADVSKNIITLLQQRPHPLQTSRKIWSTAEKTAFVCKIVSRISCAADGDDGEDEDEGLAVTFDLSALSVIRPKGTFSVFVLQGCGFICEPLSRDGDAIQTVTQVYVSNSLIHLYERSKGKHLLL